MTKATRRQYTEEFKREAVKLVVEEGPKVSEVARNLGIDRSLLERWRRQFAEGAVADGATGSAEEKEELKHLRAEVKQLRIERDILKKGYVCVNC
jgi:transposase